MTKSQRVKPVIKVAKNRESEAARVLADGQRVVQERRQRLAELRSYREEYRNRYKKQGSVGMNAQQLRTFRNFLAKLDLAVEQQEQLVNAAQRDLEQKKSKWMEKHFRTKALDNVRGRYLSQEQRAEQRAEQKESDERSQRASGVKDDRSSSDE